MNVDLGVVAKLRSALVVDRVTSGGGNGGFVGGLSDYTLQFSLQGFTDSTFTTAIGTALLFSHAPPFGASSPSDFAFTAALDGLTARYIQYSVVSTPGSNPGLSNLTFNTAVPEPAAWAMMVIGFGAVGFMRRRRQGGVTFA